MTDELTPKIRARAKSWASQITKQAKENLGKFNKLIAVRSTTETNGGVVSIKTEASNRARDKETGDVKNVARAYEYGSGLWGKENKKYRIAPRRKKVLAFHWEKFDIMEDESMNQVFNSPKFVGFAEDGRLLFRFVDHPGVRALKNGRGYMKPAIDKVRKNVRKELSKDTRDAILGTFRRAFKR